LAINPRVKLLLTWGLVIGVWTKLTLTYMIGIEFNPKALIRTLMKKVWWVYSIVTCLHQVMWGRTLDTQTRPHGPPGSSPHHHYPPSEYTWLIISSYVSLLNKKVSSRFRVFRVKTRFRVFRVSFCFCINPNTPIIVVKWDIHQFQWSIVF
jgi:hypothetical protein